MGIMPQHHRWSPVEFPLAEAQRLRAEGKNLYEIAAAIGWSYSHVRRKLAAAGMRETFKHKRRGKRNPGDSERNPADVPVDGDHAERNGHAPAIPASQPIAVPSQPIAMASADDTALHSAQTLADHETRLQALESFIATLQAQAQQPITVQSSAVYALPSAELPAVQTWEDPEDAKPERWNLWLPRGLKRRIEAQAKAAGIAPSQLVQRLLMAALNGGGADA
jgi:hypothetical protein